MWLFQGFTGITQEYERPDAPELVIQTVGRTIEESTMEVISLLESQVCILKMYFAIIEKKKMIIQLFDTKLEIHIELVLIYDNLTN